MKKTKEKNGLNISVQSFITAIVVIFVLMILTYGLTFVIPGGEYARITDESGNMIIDTVAGYHQVDGGMPFWKKSLCIDGSDHTVFYGNGVFYRVV